MSLQELYSQRLSSIYQFSAGFAHSECHPKYIRFQQSHECKCPRFELHISTIQKYAGNPSLSLLTHTINRQNKRLKT